MSEHKDIQQENDTLPVNLNVTPEDDKVVIAFDKDVSWIGLTPEQALLMAEKLKVASITVLRSQPKSVR